MNKTTHLYKDLRLKINIHTWGRSVKIHPYQNFSFSLSQHCLFAGVCWSGVAWSLLVRRRLLLLLWRSSLEELFSPRGGEETEEKATRRGEGERRFRRRGQWCLYVSPASMEKRDGEGGGGGWRGREEIINLGY